MSLKTARLLFRIIGGCIIFPIPFLLLKPQILWMNAERGTFGVLITLVNFLILGLAFIGSVQLLRVKKSGAYLIYIATGLSFLGGIVFSYIPLINYLFPLRLIWIPLNLGNLIVIVILVIAHKTIQKENKNLTN